MCKLASLLLSSTMHHAVPAGVFEAKHKTLGAMAGSKSRYRSQVRQAVALSLQQAGAPQHMLNAVPGLLAPVVTGSRAAPTVRRGVAAMLPQLGGSSLASTPVGPWGVQAEQAATHDAFVSAAAAAAAASHANSVALSAQWLGMAGYTAAGGVMLPGAQQFAPYQGFQGLSTSCSTPAAMSSAKFMPATPLGSWVSPVTRTLTVPLAAGHMLIAGLLGLGHRSSTIGCAPPAAQHMRAAELVALLLQAPII